MYYLINNFVRVVINYVAMQLPTKILIKLSIVQGPRFWKIWLSYTIFATYLHGLFVLLLDVDHTDKIFPN